MNDFNAGTLLHQFTTVSAESIKDLRHMVLDDLLREDVPGFAFCLNVIISGVVTRKPVAYYNTYTSEDDLADVLRYIETGSTEGTPHDTLRLLQYLSDSGMVGLNKVELFDLLQNHGAVQNVHRFIRLLDVVSSGCTLCGGVTDDEVCGFCKDALSTFTAYRAGDHYIGTLLPENYKRASLLSDGKCELEVGPYVVQVEGARIEFKRIHQIRDARLPITEYQVPLS